MPGYESTLNPSRSFWQTLFSQWSLPDGEKKYAQVLEPQFERQKKSVVESRVHPGQERSRLGSERAPLELRMNALLAIQHVPPRHACGLLREALADHADDLRLLAYGMLDGKEKQIAAHIHSAREALQNASEGKALYSANKQLAELYLELVYQGLVQGDMRRHALEQVQKYAAAALRHHARDTGLWVISGRMRMLSGDNQGAHTAFATAISMGLPRSRAQSYLAELAFLRRDFSAVREHMRQIRAESRSQQMALLANYWGQA